MTFTTTIKGHGDLNATGIVVPEAVAQALGSKPAKVVVTLNGYSYGSTLAVMGGDILLPLAQEHRAKAGVGTGQQVEVEVEPDLAPREVTVPEDLAAALAEAGLTERFAALAFSRRKEHVRAVDEAKATETRARRVANVVAMLGFFSNGGVKSHPTVVGKVVFQDMMRGGQVPDFGSCKLAAITALQRGFGWSGMEWF